MVKQKGAPAEEIENVFKGVRCQQVFLKRLVYKVKDGRLCGSSGFNLCDSCSEAAETSDVIEKYGGG